jgi:ATP-dependent Clp protease adaptor protein ClpS
MFRNDPGQVKARVETPDPAAYAPVMADVSEPAVLPDVERENQTKPKDALEPGWLVICWNDPVNLMVYVTHVFMAVFGWPKPKAEHHMLQVHRQGRSVLKRESMERAEFYVHQLQGYGLHATMEKEEA